MTRKHAFTMSELLIATALLLVVAAVTVPNLLTADARSRVARSRYLMRSTALAIKAYQADYDTAPYDNNDPDTPPWRRDLTFAIENEGSNGDVIWLIPVGQTSPSYMQRFYTRAPFVPLTTPVAYVHTIPLDTFSQVVPLGYDTRITFQGGGSPYRMAYCALFTAGPDRTEGNWLRNIPGQGNMGLLYDPSNGTISSGDMIRGVPIHDEEVMKKDLPFWN